MISRAGQQFILQSPSGGRATVRRAIIKLKQCRPGKLDLLEALVIGASWDIIKNTSELECTAAANPHSRAYDVAGA